jgi:hypothetical protein
VFLRCRATSRALTLLLKLLDVLLKPRSRLDDHEAIRNPRTFRDGFCDVASPSIGAEFSARYGFWSRLLLRPMLRVESRDAIADLHGDLDGRRRAAIDTTEFELALMYRAPLIGRVESRPRRSTLPGRAVTRLRRAALL